MKERQLFTSHVRTVTANKANNGVFSMQCGLSRPERASLGTIRYGDRSAGEPGFQGWWDSAKWF